MRQVSREHVKPPPCWSQGCVGAFIFSAVETEDQRRDILRGQDGVEYTGVGGGGVIMEGVVGGGKAQTPATEINPKP